MHLDAKSNHIFFILNFYAFRLFIDYRESTVQFKRRVPSFLPGIELRNCRVCQLHFPESDYSTTSIHKRLNDDAVPQLILNLIDSTFASPSTSRSGDIISIAEDENMQEDCTLENPFDEFIDLKASPSWDDFRVQHTPSLPQTRRQNLEISPNPASNVESLICLSAGNDSTSMLSQIFSTPKTSKQRALLGLVTRKIKLTTVASRLYRIASKLWKKQSKFRNQLSAMKERSGNSEKYTTMVMIKELKNLPTEQLAFIDMQIRNIHEKAKSSRNCDPSCRFH